MAARAIEQYKEVYRLDPADSESALWLARLYRLRNEHDKAEDVLRSLLKQDPDNETAVEQLTQLLLDEGKSADAVLLLESITSRTPSPTLLDLLGDAYTQTHDLAKAEAAYRKATELDPSELSHHARIGPDTARRRKIRRRARRLPEACRLDARRFRCLPASGANLQGTPPTRPRRRESSESPPVRARQPRGHVQRGHALRSAGPLRRRHSRALRRRHRPQVAIDRAALAPPLAGHSVPATRPALPRHAEFPGRDLYLRRARPSRRRRRSPRAHADHGHLPRRKELAQGTSGWQRRPRKISQRPRTSYVQRASARGKRPDRRSRESSSLAADEERRRPRHLSQHRPGL